MEQSKIGLEAHSILKCFAQSLGYAIKSVIEKEFTVTYKGETEQLDGSVIENLLISEFWAAANRSTDYRVRQITNEEVDTAKAYTKAYLTWCRETGCNPVLGEPPKWGRNTDE